MAYALATLPKAAVSHCVLAYLLPLVLPLQTGHNQLFPAALAAQFPFSRFRLSLMGQQINFLIRVSLLLSVALLACHLLFAA